MAVEIVNAPGLTGVDATSINADCMTFIATEYATAERFTAALRHVPSAVCIVTTYVDTRPWGLTVSAFASVSAQPPTVLVCVNRRTGTCASIEGSGAFGISFLSESQRHVAESGAAPGVPKFLEAHTSDEHSGYSPDYGLSVGSIECGPARQYYWSSSRVSSPAVFGAYCHLDCSVERIVDGGDTHAIVIGRVEIVADRAPDGARPLVYHDAGFHALGARLGDRADDIPLGATPVKGAN
jgi:flavin reductase (DIM6/NTAB) family NADH-FMN oxidoreductase RutF